MITLDCLRALYAIDYTPVATSKNSYGIGQFLFYLLSSYNIWLIVFAFQSNSHLSLSWVPTWTCFSGAALFLHNHLYFLAMICRNFSPSLVGVRPKAVLIDGGL